MTDRVETESAVRTGEARLHGAPFAIPVERSGATNVRSSDAYKQKFA
jgi:hypothetical protein